MKEAESQELSASFYIQSSSVCRSTIILLKTSVRIMDAIVKANEKVIYSLSSLTTFGIALNLEGRAE
ncbi:hypothetical protein SAMN05216353_1353 [Halobacillus alkaliphilus]|uniref:Uncharacterized protein n=1 Tax=Halobacillus alkaliphilus TaxID=396056 RepID=A0A1I2R210_9BACI|nr:hypothetical protein SAMN05216353_1353 [Halobacillus alkaliphilus]